MAALTEQHKASEMSEALATSRGGLIGVAVLSAVLNMLLLAGSLYMMMVYDVVLPSHSIPSLIGLFAIVTMVYAFQGVFDTFRSRMLGDVAASLSLRLTGRVHDISHFLSLSAGSRAEAALVGRDLDQIRAFLLSPGPLALIDLPWIVPFIIILSLLHIWLGVATLCGAVVLAGLAWWNNHLNSAGVKRLSAIAAVRSGHGEANRHHGETIRALGMNGRMRQRWIRLNRHYEGVQRELSENSGTLSGVSKVFRLFLQSAVLTVGALLVIDGKASGGVIFASSILSSRALAPVDQAIANWNGFLAASQGWKRLSHLLKVVPAEEVRRVTLPDPKGNLQVEQLSLKPPGTDHATVRNVTFSLAAGDVVGVIGPSASGKSSLVRGIVGLWLPLGGAVRLDGATLDQWAPDDLGRHIGYLPQTVELLDGTVAENISRFEPDAPSPPIIEAAQIAGVHEMILRLHDGYETQVGPGGAFLSAGQRQRIALARALYRDPFLVVLDEPNSNLDADGDAALLAAMASVRERSGIVIVVAHRPIVLNQVQHVLYMVDGQMRAFGPKDQVLRKILASPVRAVPNQGEEAAAAT